MGKGIKTRVAQKGIKAIDKAAVASERMKEAYIRTKDKAEHGLYAEEGSPGEYASDRVSSNVDSAAHEAVYQFDSRGGRGERPQKKKFPRSRKIFKSARLQPNSRKNKQKNGRRSRPASGLGRIRWIVSQNR